MRVLIVGGGPCGLAVAKALSNCGIYPTVIEKEAHIRSEGAGIAIPANGTWALNGLGIPIQDTALLIPSMQFTDDQGEILVQENLESIHPEGAQFYAMSRDALMQLLLNSLDPRVLIKTSTTLKQFVEKDHLVHVELSNGQVESYDWVIGCDGIYSQVRSFAHPEEKPGFLHLYVLRAMLDTPFVDMPVYMLGGDRACLLYPMPDQKTYFYAHLFEEEKGSSSPSFQELLSSFGGAIPQSLQALSDQIHRHHMERSHSVRFRLDRFSRVLLLGDAAHAFGPMLQNGAAQAFEDAYVLQELLQKTRDIPELIVAFENRRRARVEQIFNISCMKIQALSDPLQLQGRNEAIRKNGAPNVNGFKLIMRENP